MSMHASHTEGQETQEKSYSRQPSSHYSKVSAEVDRKGECWMTGSLKYKQTNLWHLKVKEMMIQAGEAIKLIPDRA